MGARLGDSVRDAGMSFVNAFQLFQDRERDEKRFEMEAEESREQRRIQEYYRGLAGRQDAREEESHGLRVQELEAGLEALSREQEAAAVFFEQNGMTPEAWSLLSEQQRFEAHMEQTRAAAGASRAASAESSFRLQQLREMSPYMLRQEQGRAVQAEGEGRSSMSNARVSEATENNRIRENDIGIEAAELQLRTLKEGLAARPGSAGREGQLAEGLALVQQMQTMLDAFKNPLTGMMENATPEFDRARMEVERTVSKLVSMVTEDVATQYGVPASPVTAPSLGGAPQGRKAEGLGGVLRLTEEGAAKKAAEDAKAAESEAKRAEELRVAKGRKLYNVVVVDPMGKEVVYGTDDLAEVKALREKGRVLGEIPAEVEFPVSLYGQGAEALDAFLRRGGMGAWRAGLRGGGTPGRLMDR